MEDEANPEIYKNSKISLEHFVALLVLLVDYLRIKKRGQDMLVEFIRAILPEESVLQNIKTYSKLIKIFGFKKINQRYACGNCGISLLNKEDCTNQECIDFFRKPKHLNKDSTLITEFNVEHDLKLILTKNWTEIAKYKLELAKNTFSDVCNSVSYKSKQIALNSISLLFFIDGATFTNTGKETTWAIVAFIANLPPRIRNAFYNVLKFTFITSRLFNFNSIFSKQMNKLKGLLKNGIIVKDTQLVINIHNVMADAVGRPKLCNSKQFNGYFGCLHCQNRGRHINKTHCYPGINPIKRTKDDYEDHVKLAGVDGFRGINGPSFLSELMTLPDDVIIGDMHLCDEGCTKQFLNLFFLPKNHRAPFYLLRHINGIDKTLKLIKYPREIKKTQRSLTAYVHFNANEFRSLINYALIYILKKDFLTKHIIIIL